VYVGKGKKTRESGGLKEKKEGRRRTRKAHGAQKGGRGGARTEGRLLLGMLPEGKKGSKTGAQRQRQDQSIRGDFSPKTVLGGTDPPRER